MPHTEDYLDSLLNEINKSENTSHKTTDGLGTVVDTQPKPSFLDEFESTLSSEEEDFLKEFEKDLGIDDDFAGLEDDTDIFLTDNIDKDTSQKAKHKSAPKNNGNDILEDDLLSELTDILDSADEVDINGMGAHTMDDFTIEVSQKEVSQKEAAPTAKEEDVLTDVEDGGGEDGGSTPEEPEGSLTDLDVQSMDPDSEAPAAEAEEGVLTDVEENGEVLEDVEDSVLTDVEEAEAPASDAGEALGEEGGGEAPSEDEATISQEEVLDIGNLLDSIDEEGNIAEDSPEANLVDETGQKSKEELEDEKTPEAEGEKKGGILGKILGILKGLTKTKEEPEEAEESEDSGEETIDESAAVDKKELKRQKAEQKKKEKEEKKKKAKEEKAAKEAAKKEKAAAKPPKVKKPKQKDNSPKIPIIGVLAFILLAGSLFMLWRVATNTISYQTTTKTAEGNFDRGNYLESYRQLAGMDMASLKEEDVILLNKARHMAYLEMMLKDYKLAIENDRQIQAIDALVKGEYYYTSHTNDAMELAIGDKFGELGRQIEEILSSDYGVSSRDAKDLLNIRDRKSYTRELYKILEREGLWSLEQ